MTDDEVNELLPVVDEFVDAVEANDAGFIKSCLAYRGRAPAIAVILAQRLTEAEVETASARGAVRDARKQYAATMADNDQLRAELKDARERVTELRSILHAAGRRVT